MRRVVARACQTHQMHVSVDDHRLGRCGGADQAEPGRCLALVHLASGGQRVVLAMLHQRFVQHAAIGKNAPHHHAVHDGAGAVGESNSAGFGHHAKLGHGRAVEAARRRAVEMQSRAVDAGGTKAE